MKTVIFLLMIGVSSLWAHETQHESSHDEGAVAASASEAEALKAINELYQKEISPIFENKCFDCHGTQKRFPWYQNLPGAKQLIQRDLQEAKEHLQLGAQFPFESHAAPVEDLEAIEKSTVQSNEMPPLLYRLMHPETKLTLEEKNKVQRWVQFGKERLKKNP